MKSNFESEESNDRIEAIYQLDVSKMIGKQYVGMFDDMARFVIIQIAIQIMLFSMDPSTNQILSADFLILLLFIVIGVGFYWLVFKKLFSFK